MSQSDLSDERDNFFKKIILKFFVEYYWMSMQDSQTFFNTVRYKL